jgi:hypothetical protein
MVGVLLPTAAGFRAGPAGLLVVQTILRSSAGVSTRASNLSLL